MGSLLLVGLLLGMRHAIEADHVAAVVSLSGRRCSLGQALRLGGAWGLGHTLALFLFGSVVIFLDATLSESVARGLEMAVGLMLIVLGADMLRRLLRDRVHFHGHHHADGSYHLHAHSHAGEGAFRQAGSGHHHHHPKGFALRALVVGSIHGMAGSAAVILLALGSVASAGQGLLYIFVFGLGSIVGMGILSVAISLPLRRTTAQLGAAHNAFQGVCATLTMALGVWLAIENSLLLTT